MNMLPILVATAIGLLALQAETRRTLIRSNASPGTRILLARDSGDGTDAPAPEWTDRCVKYVCTMSKEVLRGDQEHPSDPTTPEYISIGLFFARSARRPASVAFLVPANADPDQGLVITFSRTERKNGSRCSGDSAPVSCYEVKFDKEALVRLKFNRCGEKGCSAGVTGGIVEEKKENRRVDLLDEFLTHDHVHFLYMRHGEAYRAMDSLAPFRMRYEEVLEKLDSR